MEKLHGYGLEARKIHGDGDNLFCHVTVALTDGWNHYLHVCIMQNVIELLVAKRRLAK